MRSISGDADDFWRLRRREACGVGLPVAKRRPARDFFFFKGTEKRDVTVENTHGTERRLRGSCPCTAPPGSRQGLSAEGADVGGESPLPGAGPGKDSPHDRDGPKKTPAGAPLPLCVSRGRLWCCVLEFWFHSFPIPGAEKGHTHFVLFLYDRNGTIRRKSGE